MRFTLFIILLFSISNLLVAQVKMNFSADTTRGCENLTVQFQLPDSIIIDLDTAPLNKTDYDWKWYFGNDDTDASADPALVEYDQVGAYTVKLVFTDKQTSQKDSITKKNYIIVRESPTASFTYSELPEYYISYDRKFVSESQLIDEAYNYTFSWYFDDGDTSDSDTTIVHHYKKKGIYEVILVVEDDYGCSDTHTEDVEIIDEALEIPNLFTPNGDGINEQFIVETNGETIYQLMIFTRWGAVIYKSSSNQIIWDGHTSAGVLANPGVYYYTISSDLGDSQNGYVHLFRD